MRDEISENRVDECSGRPDRTRGVLGKIKISGDPDSQVASCFQTRYDGAVYVVVEVLVAMFQNNAFRGRQLHAVLAAPLANSVDCILKNEMVVESRYGQIDFDVICELQVSNRCRDELFLVGREDSVKQSGNAATLRHPGRRAARPTEGVTHTNAKSSVGQVVADPWHRVAVNPDEFQLPQQQGVIDSVQGGPLIEMEWFLLVDEFSPVVSHRYQLRGSRLVRDKSMLSWVQNIVAAQMFRYMRG